MYIRIFVGDMRWQTFQYDKNIRRRRHLHREGTIVELIFKKPHSAMTHHFIGRLLMARIWSICRKWMYNWYVGMMYLLEVTVWCTCDNCDDMLHLHMYTYKHDVTIHHCIRVCVYICIHMNINLHFRWYRTPLYTCVCVCVCMCIHTYVYTYAYTYTYTYTYIYIYIICVWYIYIFICIWYKYM